MLAREVLNVNLEKENQWLTGFSKQITRDLLYMFNAFCTTNGFEFRVNVVRKRPVKFRVWGSRKKRYFQKKKKSDKAAESSWEPWLEKTLWAKMVPACFFKKQIKAQKLRHLVTENLLNGTEKKKKNLDAKFSLHKYLSGS